MPSMLAVSWPVSAAPRDLSTIVAPGTQGLVAGDASRWTPWGSYITAEESWGTGSQKGRLFEVTNSTTAAANGGNFIQRNVVPRVSHEGLAFDSQKSMYFIDELNGGSIYKYVSSNANAATGDPPRVAFAASSTRKASEPASGPSTIPTAPCVLEAAT